MAVELPPGLEEDEDLSQDIGGDTPRSNAPVQLPYQFHEEEIPGMALETPREFQTILAGPQILPRASEFVKAPTFPVSKLVPSGQELQTAIALSDPDLTDEEKAYILANPPQPTTGVDVAAGLAQSAAGQAESMTSPLMAGALVAGAKLPPAGQRLLSGGFALDMLSNIPALAQRFGAAVGEKVPGAIARAAGDILGTSLMTGAGAVHSLSPRAIIAPESVRALGEQPYAIRQQETGAPVRRVPEQPVENVELPAEEGGGGVPPSRIPPGDEAGAPRAEEEGHDEVSLSKEQLRRIQGLEMKVQDRLMQLGSETPGHDLISVTEGRDISDADYEAGLRRMLASLDEQLTKPRKAQTPEGTVNTLADWEHGAPKKTAALEQGQEMLQKEEGAATETPTKPEVAKPATSRFKNPQGDPMGTTYHATPEDWAAWQEQQAKLTKFAKEGGDLSSAEGQALFKENERIKNKYGGMPPEAPKPEAPKLTEASPFEHKDFVTTDASGNAVVDLEKLQKGLEEGRVKGGEAANQLLSHLLKPDPNHPLKAIRVVDTNPAGRRAMAEKQPFGIAEQAALRQPYRGLFYQEFGARPGNIEILTRDAQGNPISHAEFVKTLNHELTHNAVTSKYESAPAEVKADLQKLFDHAKEQAKGTEFENHNAMADVHEFLSEAASSPKIQTWLTKMAYEGAGKAKNAWGKFVELVHKILRAPSDLPLTALDEAMRVSGELEGIRREAKAPAEERFSPEEEERLTPEEQKEQQLGIVPPVVQKTMEFVRNLPGDLKVASAELAGKSAPATSAKSPAAGNALVRYASAQIAAPEVAKSMATDVLGPDHYQDYDFGNELGAVLVEDRLRAIRRELHQAGDTAGAAKVNTIIGQKGSPFQTAADFDRALRDPDIRAAIERHKKTVQKAAQSAHKAAGGTLAGPGLNTGAFVNLKAIFEGNEESLLGGGGRGNLQNPLRRPSRFSKEAKGTAENYELDYRTLAERMIKGNFEESAKRQMYARLIKDGLAQLADPGDPRPEINGKPAVKFTIERKGLPAGGGKARTYVKNLWVSADIEPELRRALNTDGRIQRAGLLHAINLFNRIQLAGPTDAVWHTANMLGSIAGSPGGKTLLADVARQLPGVNIMDAVGRTVASSIGVLRDSPEIQRQVAELARIGAMRQKGQPGRFTPVTKFLSLVDKAGRLVRDDMYNNLVQRGLVNPSEAGRREFVNQMGQYNPRLMSQMQLWFKERGFSPFVVAGRNFNRMAMRRLTLDPGVEAASPAAAAQMRAVNAFGTLATLFAVPALFNYIITGSPSGRAGTKMGQIDTGKDYNGRHVVIDPAQWTGLRRGLRISGLQAVIEGARGRERAGKIAPEVIRDVIGGVVHPWAGPGVTVGSVAATGWTPAMYKESENPKDYGKNVEAALEQINPLVKGYLKGKKENINPAAQIGLQLGGAAGVKTVPARTPKDTLSNVHATWLSKNEDPKVKADFERNQAATFPVSQYRDLDKALQAGDKKAVLKAISDLQPLVRKDSDIYKRMRPYLGSGITLRTKPLFHESAALERKFKDSLSEEDMKLYQRALDERDEQWDLFKEVWAERPDRPESKE